MKCHVVLFIAVAAMLIGCRSLAHAQSNIPWPSVLTIRGDTTSLAPKFASGVTYVILYNIYSCKDCFSTLKQALHDYDSSRGRTSESIVVIRTQAGAIGRRLALNDVKKILPAIHDIYFDCLDTSAEDPWPPVDLNGGIFGSCGISKTPALLVINERGDMPLQCFTYDELFGNDEPGQPDDAHILAIVDALDAKLSR